MSPESPSLQRSAYESLQFVAVGSSADLTEGQMRAVQVSGNRVLITMVEGVPYAMGAICTHERANLDEGTLMGHELYCPLHFSCFDVRTGEALSPPADRAAPVYAVKVQDGTVFVSAEPVDPEILSLEAPGGAAEELAEPAEQPSEPGAEPCACGGESLAATAPVAVPGPTTWHARLLERLEELPGLERGAEALGSTLRPVREHRLGGRIFDLLHGRMTGHALHPALSDLPIGFWAGAVVLDVAGQTTGALILSAGGIVAGVATAATGVADWTVSDGRDRRVGLLHGVLQTVALLTVSTSVALRLLDALLPGQVLNAAGLGISAASAYLGGHLVLGRGVMVDHTAWTRGPRTWTRTVEVAELSEGRAKAVPLEGREVLVSMIDGTVAVIENACSHAGAPLSLGTIEGGVVRCPWHGSCFRLRDGAVVKGPASHPQPMLDARVRDGWVEVRGRGRW